MMVTLQEFAAALIPVFEGERLKAYKDSGGVWTIGIGHTKNVTPNMVITPEQAQSLFAEDAAPLLKLVADRPILEAAALTSYGFNLGEGALRKLLAGNNQIMNAVHDKAGHLLPGLVARRRLEDVLIRLSQGK
jgi:GH24 family phage-related lysozyme (muramidase)